MLDSGIMLYDWMENNVSQSDDSWINDFSNPWKGTSVFGAISLGEGIKNCGGILESKDLKRMRERLRKAANFIDSFIKFGKSDVKFAGPNINYLAAAAHALAISGEVLDEPKFTERAKYFGKGSIKYITEKDFLIYGETQPTGLTSPNGCKGGRFGIQCRGDNTVACRIRPRNRRQRGARLNGKDHESPHRICAPRRRMGQQLGHAQF